MTGTKDTKNKTECVLSLTVISTKVPMFLRVLSCILEEKDKLVLESANKLQLSGPFK